MPLPWRLIAALVLIAALAGTGVPLAVRLIAESGPGELSGGPTEEDHPEGYFGPETVLPPPPKPQVSQAQIEMAKELAASYGPLQERLSGKRFRNVGVYPFGQGVYLPEERQPSFYKDSSVDAGCDKVPCVQVYFYDYTNSLTHEMLVDLAAQSVVRAQFGEHPGPGPVLSHEEVLLAHAIADADLEVQALVGPEHSHPTLAMHVSDIVGSSPCAVHRCAVVPYHVGTPYDAELLWVKVDLLTEQIVYRGPPS